MNTIFCSHIENIRWLEFTGDREDTTVYLIRAEEHHALPMDDLLNVLSAEEQDRANRFLNEEDRCVYALSHGMLRKILASRLSCKPVQLVFETGKHGKPALPVKNIHFNISHSGATVLIAVSGMPVGIDVEWMRQDFAYEELLATNFCEQERDTIMLAADKRSMFYRLWARKEALLKADGIGLIDDLTSIDVSDEQSALPVSLSNLSGGWRVTSFPAGVHYMGCIATQSESVSFMHVLPRDI